MSIFESVPFFSEATTDVTLHQSSLPLPLHVLTLPTFSHAATPSIKPSITMVYSRRQKAVAQMPLPTTISSKGLDLSPSLDDNLLVTLWKSNRSCTLIISSTAHPIEHFLSYDHLSLTFRCFTPSVLSPSVLNTIHEALAHHGWRQAMTEELTVLHDNQT